MSASAVKIHGGSAAWILPCVLTNGKLDDTFGTLMKFQVVSRVGISYPVGSEAAESEYVEINMANGVKMQKDARTIVVDGAGGVKAGGTSGATSSITIDIHENDMATLVALQSVGDNPMLVCVPLGESDTEGYAYLIAKFGGPIETERAGNAGNAISLQMNGKSYELDTTGGVTGSTFSAAAASAITSLQQYGTLVTLDPSTNAPLVAGDVASGKLLSGNIVFKD